MSVKVYSILTLVVFMSASLMQQAKAAQFTCPAPGKLQADNAIYDVLVFPEFDGAQYNENKMLCRYKDLILERNVKGSCSFSPGHNCTSKNHKPSECILTCSK